jgi:orotidine-5'-phosphate decarboxylase
MNRQELIAQIKKKKSYLCIGLDTDITKIPHHLLKSTDPVFEFNKQIIDATHPYCVAYKPNTAFYEALGSKGWESLQKTVDYIPEDCFIIADAKRADIGNTSALYAKAFFETLNVHALTVAPYMGEDSIRPFLEHKDKWTIVLALTSNDGSNDFQTFGSQGHELYTEVIKKCIGWASADQLMFVVGATKPAYFHKIRTLAPHYFLLVPGVGTQGGNLKEISSQGMNSECGLLVNSSRAILYASSEKDFSSKAAQQAITIQHQMETLLEELL